MVAGVRRTFPKLQRLYLQTMLALWDVSPLALFAVEGTGQVGALSRLTPVRCAPEERSSEWWAQSCADRQHCLREFACCDAHWRGGSFEHGKATGAACGRRQCPGSHTGMASRSTRR